MTAPADLPRAPAEMNPNRSAETRPPLTRHDQHDSSIATKHLNPARYRGIGKTAGPQYQPAQPFRQLAKHHGWIWQPVAIGKYP
jgi:hypothetical protein